MSFVDRFLPPGDDFWSTATDIWRSRPDLQAACPDSRGIDYRKWLAVYGPLEYPDRLGVFFPPLPPAHLRHTACGGTEAVAHLRTGLDDAEILYELAASFVDAPDTSVRAVLDVGCACGRLARWLPAVFPAAAVHGSDVRKAAVEWCQQHLPGTFVANDTAPPLPFAPASFDVILVLSVFTHLPRDSNERWIQELVRVCRPGGRIIVSMLGSFALFVIQRYRANQEFFKMTPAMARDYLRRLPREHWMMHSMSRAWVDALDGVESAYGQVFNDEVFVRTAWAPYADVVGTLPAGQGLFQDYYILEPRG